jgi:hypothetical protein
VEHRVGTRHRVGKHDSESLSNLMLEQYNAEININGREELLENHINRFV